MPELVVVYLKVILELLVTNAMPMLVVYWIFERPIVDDLFIKMTDFFQTKLAISIRTVKRFMAIGASILISLGLYLLYAKLGYAEIPVGFETWANLVLTLGAVNFVGTQVIQSKDLPLK